MSWPEPWGQVGHSIRCTGGAVESCWSLTGPVTDNNHRELWSLISTETKWRPIGEAQVNYGEGEESITARVVNIFWQDAVMKLVESEDVVLRV